MQSRLIRLIEVLFSNGMMFSVSDKSDSINQGPWIFITQAQNGQVANNRTTSFWQLIGPFPLMPILLYVVAFTPLQQNEWRSLTKPIQFYATYRRSHYII